MTLRGTVSLAAIEPWGVTLMGGAQDEQLATLRDNWGAVYRITVRGDKWTAVRRATRAVIERPNPDALALALREDYSSPPTRKRA